MRLPCGEARPRRKDANGIKLETTTDDREDDARTRGDREAGAEAGEERGEEGSCGGRGSGRNRGSSRRRRRGDGAPRRAQRRRRTTRVLAFESARRVGGVAPRTRHADEPGVWIKIAKKGSGIPSVTHAEALDVALCYGWIDGQARSVDETWYVQKFTPAPGAQPVVEAQPREGRGADRGGPDAAGRAGRDRAREGGRALGRGVRRPGGGDRAGRPARRRSTRARPRQRSSRP